MSCDSCGGSGWFAWRPIVVATGKRELVWSACAWCNDDGDKPRHEDLCEACGESEPFCECDI